jgi:hypothetical protein
MFLFWGQIAQPRYPVANAHNQTQVTFGPVNDTSSPSLDRNEPSPANPFINPEKLNRVPAATDYVFDAVLDKGNSLRLPFSPYKRLSGRRR